MKRGFVTALILMLGILGTVSCNKQEGPVREAISHKDDYQQAYIYAFPMIAAYKAMYQFNVDKTNSQYKGPFNKVLSDSQVFTPKDTAIVTPNSDTPYSMLEVDLRAEPVVFCVPKVDKNRYYSVQLTDMYTFNYGYVGSRATGSDAGCYMVAGPGWKGDTPKGIKKVFNSETQFGLLIYRTQLFNPADINNVKKIQAGYTAQPLSAYLKQPAPPASPAIDFPAFTDDAFKTDFPRYLDFLLQFCPEVPEEKGLRAKFASIGIAAGQPFDPAKLSDAQKAELGLGVKEGYDAIEKEVAGVGKNINGWKVASAFGDRAFYHGDYLLRAAAARAGVFGNDAAEAMYPMSTKDGSGEVLDASKHNYTLTFPAGQFPPVNAFWSVTMYDGKTQLLIENPINRYLINSPMLPSLKKNKDGSLTLYIQKDAPPADKKANWLPAPDGTIYLVMRLYWPKTQPPSILPPGDGTWKPPAVTVAQ
ncbi:MAG: DUF1254 domain-containing protein [Candidatus Korobacteraceae bacterium]